MTSRGASALKPVAPRAGRRRCLLCCALRTWLWWGTACTPAPWPGSALRPEPSADSLLPPPRASGAVIVAPGKKARESVGSVDHRGAPADCVYLLGLRRGCVCGGGGGAPALAGGGGGPLCPPVPPAHCGRGRRGEAWLEGSSQDRADRSRLESSSPQAGRPPWREHLTRRRSAAPRPSRSGISAARKVPAPSCPVRLQPGHVGIRQPFKRTAWSLGLRRPPGSGSCI